MKRIMLFLFFLALGLLSISCGKISIGGSSDKNADDLQTNDGTNPAATKSFSGGYYYLPTDSYRGKTYHFDGGGNYEAMDCDYYGTPVGTKETGTYRAEKDKIVLKGSDYAWDGASELKGFTLMDKANPCYKTKGPDYDAIAGVYDHLRNSGLYAFFRKDGKKIHYECDHSGQKDFYGIDFNAMGSRFPISDYTPYLSSKMVDLWLGSSHFSWADWDPAAGTIKPGNHEFVSSRLPSGVFCK